MKSAPAAVAVCFGATAISLLGTASCERFLQDAPLVGLGSLEPIGIITDRSSSAASFIRGDSKGKPGELLDEEILHGSAGAAGGGVLEQEVVQGLETDAQVTGKLMPLMTLPLTKYLNWASIKPVASLRSARCSEAWSFFVTCEEIVQVLKAINAYPAGNIAVLRSLALPSSWAGNVATLPFIPWA